MVSAGEARQQLGALRQQVQQARPQAQAQQRDIAETERLIEQKRRQLEQTQRKLKLTPAQLRSLTRRGLAQEQKLKGTFQEQKQALEKSAKTISQAKAKVSGFISRLVELEKIARKGITTTAAGIQLQKTLDVAAEQGLRPVIREDVLVGFRDDVLGQTISLEKGLQIVQTPFTKTPTLKKITPGIIPGIRALEEGREELRVIERPGVKAIPELVRLVERPRDIKLPRDIKPPSISKFLVPGLPVGIGVGVPATDLFIGKGKIVRPSDTTQALFQGLEEKGFSKQKIASFTTLSDENIDKIKGLDEKQKTQLKKISDFQESFIVGGLKEIEEDPEKIIAITALNTLTPAALSAVSGLRILNRVPTSIKKKGGKAVSKFLTGLYLANVGLQIASEPSKKLKAERAGRIVTGEILPFSIGTRLGVKGLLRQELKAELNSELAKLPANKRAAFEDYMKQAEVFGRFEPQARNIKLDNIESIPDPNAQKVIRKFLRDSKGNVVVGGSVAQTGQVRIQRKLGDMDLYLETGTPNNAAKNLANQLKQAGVPRVSNIRGQVTIGGKKAIEFHDIDRLFANINQVVPSWKSPRSYIIRTPEGIIIQRIGLQAQRKLVAAFADPKRFATGKYKKDLQDFKTIANKIFRNAELNARQSFFFRESKIKRVETIFGKKISRKPFPAPIEKFKKPTKLKIVEPAKALGEGIKISKKVNGQIKFREPNILQRARIKASQKPFTKPSQLPSQVKIKPSEPFLIRKAPISQPPLKRTGLRSQPPIKPFQKKVGIPIPSIPSQPPTKPPFTPIFPPSQPPTKPPIKPPFIPGIPSQPPVKPPTTLIPPKVPFRSQTTKKKPLKRKSVSLGTGYNVFVKRGSLKGLKVKRPTTRGKPLFQKANIRPLTKSQARDLGAFVTDRTISQTFKIKKTNKTAKKPLVKFPRNYFQITQRKWRGKIVKGKEQPFKNRIIERRKNAIDTLGEKRQLRVGAEISRLRRTRRITI